MRAPSFEEQIEDWGKAGAPLLTNSLAAIGMPGARHCHHGACPLPSSDVPRLFDPSQAEPWRRSSTVALSRSSPRGLAARRIPGFLGPPRGSFLDRLIPAARIRPDFRRRHGIRRCQALADPYVQFHSPARSSGRDGKIRERRSFPLLRLAAILEKHCVFRHSPLPK